MDFNLTGMFEMHNTSDKSGETGIYYTHNITITGLLNRFSPEYIAASIKIAKKRDYLHRIIQAILFCIIFIGIIFIFTTAYFSSIKPVKIVCFILLLLLIVYEILSIVLFDYIPGIASIFSKISFHLAYVLTLKERAELPSVYKTTPFDSIFDARVKDPVNVLNNCVVAEQIFSFAGKNTDSLLVIINDFYLDQEHYTLEFVNKDYFYSDYCKNVSYHPHSLYLNRVTLVYNANVSAVTLDINKNILLFPGDRVIYTKTS